MTTDLQVSTKGIWMGSVRLI